MLNPKNYPGVIKKSKLQEWPDEVTCNKHCKYSIEALWEAWQYLVMLKSSPIPETHAKLVKNAERKVTNATHDNANSYYDDILLIIIEFTPKGHAFNRHAANNSPHFTHKMGTGRIGH